MVPPAQTCLAMINRIESCVVLMFWLVLAIVCVNCGNDDKQYFIIFLLGALAWGCRHASCCGGKQVVPGGSGFKK